MTLPRFAAAFCLAALGLICASVPGGADPLRARGVVRSLGEAAISGEMAARIVSAPFSEGQSFRKGDTLLAFDCERLRAEVAALGAEEAAARAAHQGNLELERFRAIGARDLAITSARLDKAAAEFAAGKARMGACVIIAPFDGTVTERVANLHEIAAPSAPLLRIIDITRLEIEVIAPSRWLSWLTQGAELTFEIDETGRAYEAHVARLSGSVDPVSQTIKVFATFDKLSPDIWPGMSGSAVFAPAGG